MLSLSLASMALLSQAANALDATQWTYIETPQPADITPVTSVTDATGIWVGGSVGNSLVVARYSSDSTFQFFRFVALNYTNDLTLIPLQNSGVSAAFPSTAGGFGEPVCASTGTVSLPIIQTFGSSLMGASTHNTNQVGTATLSLHGCDSGTLTYRFDYSDVAHDFAGLSGTIDLVKIGGCSATSP